MDLHRQRMTFLALAGMCVIPLVGCATQTQTGALVGTGAGAVSGAVIGKMVGKEKEGALIGAAIGAGTGALIGKSHDEADQKEASLRQAAHAESVRHAQERALTNRDVMDLTASNIGDSLIISSIQDRGGMFDTSPAALIALKHAGVSDSVIQAMQRLNMAR